MFAQRKYLLPLVLVVVAVGVLAANPVWATAAGLDVWNVPALQRQMATIEEHNRALAVAADDVKERIEAKEQLIRDLIAGRATLAQVTAAFLAINEGSPVCMKVIRQTFAGATDYEKHARNVVSFALARFKCETPGQHAEVRARLEDELHGLLRTLPTD